MDLLWVELPAQPDLSPPDSPAVSELPESSELLDE